MSMTLTNVFYRFSSNIHSIPVSLWFSNCMRLCVCVCVCVCVCMDGMNLKCLCLHVHISVNSILCRCVHTCTHSCTYAHTYAHTPPAPPPTPIWGLWINRAKNGDRRFSVLTVTCAFSLSVTLQPPFLSVLSLPLPPSVTLQPPFVCLSYLSPPPPPPPLSYLFPVCRT